MGMFAFRLAAEEAAKQAEVAVVPEKQEPEQARHARKPRKEASPVEAEASLEPQP